MYNGRFIECAGLHTFLSFFFFKHTSSENIADSVATQFNKLSCSTVFHVPIPVNSALVLATLPPSGLAYWILELCTV